MNQRFNKPSLSSGNYFKSVYLPTFLLPIQVSFIRVMFLKPHYMQVINNNKNNGLCDE